MFVWILAGGARFCEEFMSFHKSDAIIGCHVKAKPVEKMWMLFDQRPAMDVHNTHFQ
jgi:pentatricopeptide repeat protein